MGKLNKKVLIAGGTGFLGNNLGLHLCRLGYDVFVLTRNKASCLSLAYPACVFEWNQDGSVPDEAIKGVFAVINLAGESIAKGRWSKTRKKRLIDSRVQTTRAIGEAVRIHKPQVYLQASAIGYYGDQTDEVLTEDSISGEGFLAETCVEWENSILECEAPTRTCILRLGVILGSQGGAFKEMLTPYLSGVGAALGTGRQFLSWVHVSDVCHAIDCMLSQEAYEGVFNVTAPNPVDFNELHTAFSGYFSFLSPINVPEFVLKAALGEKSSILLSSQRVLPKNLLDKGYSFQVSTLTECFKLLLDTSYQNCGLIHDVQWVPKPISEVWDFFSVETNLEKITPPWLKFKVTHLSTPKIVEGTEIDYRLKLHGVPITWRSKILNYNASGHFEDLQLKGPYKLWHHFHDFEELNGGTVISDFVRFKMPLGILGRVLATSFVKKDVETIFNFRKKVVSKIMGQSILSKKTTK